MDFTHSPELLALKDRTRAFIDGVVIPREQEIWNSDDTAAWDALRAELQAAAQLLKQSFQKWQTAYFLIIDLKPQPELPFWGNHQK